MYPDSWFIGKVKAPQRRNFLLHLLSYEVQKCQLERNPKLIQPTETEAISRILQQGLADCNQNPLVPKAFQHPVESKALNEAIAAIAALARAPLEETLHCQQEQIRHLQEAVQRLEQRVMF